MSGTPPSRVEQAHARITAMIAWLEDALRDLTSADDFLIYEQTIFQDPYPDAASSANERSKGRDKKRAELQRKIAEAYKDDEGEQW
ncbi:hypothetical protein [Streptomyces chrestomyceticus]|uniref:hypothetical protein n=1 Tax=Streptomyces chrestomyceticus TaxID=68185 RepID=UPI0019D10F9E|nr:hypothetical protein [Streptomyces chrestomyceticus]